MLNVNLFENSTSSQSQGSLCSTIAPSWHTEHITRSFPALKNNSYFSNNCKVNNLHVKENSHSQLKRLYFKLNCKHLTGLISLASHLFCRSKSISSTHHLKISLINHKRQTQAKLLVRI